MDKEAESIQYYPCVIDNRTGRINKVVCDTPMTKDDASEYLKKHHWSKWLNCDAIPQASTSELCRDK